MDTGCGKRYGEGEQPSDLKTFIETEILRDDAASGPSEYRSVVVCTHCHFDHIGGIEFFFDDGAMICASGYDPDFNGPQNRAANSLCAAFGMPTPQYQITHFLEDGEEIRFEGVSLGLKALLTPGHTPDSLAIFDEEERVLFVGDTCYRRVADLTWGERQDAPIVIPLQGNWADFKASLAKLLSFVEAEEAGPSSQRIQIACGHTTANAPAAEVLHAVDQFANRFEAGGVPVATPLPGHQVAPGGSSSEGGFLLWQDPGEPEFSIIAPKRFEREFANRTIPARKLCRVGEKGRALQYGRTLGTWPCH
ncbi:hypothetical protein B0A55_02728 [Friedmanniomyces simplex]|uniref:Metallo-beta-lactamase domain-containing protein n=1 Tax=Friedmanniomyces simplex TaxID=329884 RepID=A0A4U0XT11_9PEZI|nr:hypothetical protein B0A55_02728 [Friedmanniomyces simplex]